MQDAELGKRLIDKLVQVVSMEGDEHWVYIHIEIQGQHDSNFAERLFIYNYRLYDRYRRPVATLALLADDSDRWKPDRFDYQLFGCQVGIHFPVVKLLDFSPQQDELLVNLNPFALVTVAHLFTRATKGDHQRRLAAKWHLAKLLYERDWDKQRIIDLFSVIDWMMQVPLELQQQLWQDIQQLERNRAMPYVTSVERIGIEKGKQIGIEIGLQQGLEQGLQQGLERGMQKGELSVLQRQLIRRFGPLPASISSRLQAATTSQLEQWAENILDAKTLEEVFAIIDGGYPACTPGKPESKHALLASLENV